ncbi:hypothetical protein PAERUG_P18_London_17_VIM_2_04_10_02081 [Pseudomonas aeruginosa]|nr:hypothetical protein PAERUG_P18_London_17_VIM_2_04_10_02081 [Pseudomonas aeruginosa]CRR27615.1 hypothetical protein PAERUG_P5_London_26_VIM_2_01_09_00027 [Pseudomonas aeruginosa]
MARGQGQSAAVAEVDEAIGGVGRARRKAHQDPGVVVPLRRVGDQCLALRGGQREALAASADHVFQLTLVAWQGAVEAGVQVDRLDEPGDVDVEHFRIAGMGGQRAVLQVVDHRPARPSRTAGVGQVAQAQFVAAVAVVVGDFHLAEAEQLGEGIIGFELLARFPLRVRIEGDQLDLPVFPEAQLDHVLLDIQERGEVEQRGEEAGFGDVEHLHQRQVGPSLVPLQALDDLVVHGEGLADEAPIAVGDQEFLAEAEQVGALDLHLVVRRKAREDGLAQHHVLLADGNLAVLVELVGPVEEVAHHDDGRCLEGLGQIRGGSVAGRLAGGHGRTAGGYG